MSVYRFGNLGCSLSPRPINQAAPHGPYFTPLRHNTKTDTTNALQTVFFSIHPRKNIFIIPRNKQRRIARFSKPCKQRTSTPQLRTSTEHRRKVAYNLSKVPNHSAPGSDRITFHAIKNAGTRLHQHLLRLFNQCLYVSQFRPIALLAIIGRIFDRILQKRMAYMIESRKLLHPHNAGFRPGRSSELLLFELHTIATEAHETSEAFMPQSSIPLIDAPPPGGHIQGKATPSRTTAHAHRALAGNVTLLDLFRASHRVHP
mmetsp:Transcript_5223/g.12560  ORF Transcript_5223/g.12560 Transcript_5223/m.12560 type:complete len:259 (-) Transcript_5223:2294-3070(-)